MCGAKRLFNTFLIPFSVCFTSSVLASPPSVPSTQRPRLHIQPGWDRRPVRPLWRPHTQPLTPEIVATVGNRFPVMLIYLHFLQVSPPHWQWRWEEVQESQYDPMSVHGHLCTDTASSSWARSDSSSMCSLVKKCRREQNILLTAFPKQMTNNYIFGLLCMIKCYVCVSAFPCACERACVAYLSVYECECACVCVCVCVRAWVLYWTLS